MAADETRLREDLRQCRATIKTLEAKVDLLAAQVDDLKKSRDAVLETFQDLVLRIAEPIKEIANFVDLARS